MKKTIIAALSVSVLALTATSAISGEIAVIVKNENSEFWQNVNKGAQAAIVNHAGHTMTFKGAASDVAIAEQIGLVENAISRSVEGIVLAPSDPEALAPIVKKAYESGIPVVIIDSALAEESQAYYQSFLSTENCKAGEAAAALMLGSVAADSKVAVMSYTAGSGSEIGRVGCFVDYLEAKSDIEIVGPFYSQSQMATALNQTTDVLAANPDLAGIFGANEPTAVGMGRALVQAGKAGSVTAIGFDGNKDLQDFVKDGTLLATAVQGSFQMGELGVNAIVDIVDGKTVPAFIDTGVVLVTKDNIDEPEAQNVLY